MNNIRDKIVGFLQNEDIRKEMRGIIKPVYDIFYNEIYIYIWFICIYHVFLIFIVLANLVILLQWGGNFRHYSMATTAMMNPNFFVVETIQPI